VATGITIGRSGALLTGGIRATALLKGDGLHG